MEGWVKLYRSFCDWEWFNISEMVHLFIHLLLNANRKDDQWRGIEIKRGQILTGLNSLNEKTGISIQTLRTCLARLESTKEITSKVTNKYRIITILKYEDYQNINGITNNQINNQLTINQQSTNSKQEVQEDKEYKSNTWRNDFSIYLEQCKEGYKIFMENPELLKTQQRLNPGVNIKLSIEKGFINFWGTEAGWKNKKDSRTKNIDWKSTIIKSISQPMNKVYYTKAELALQQ